jgi:putative Mg2+ transporter-C (MgtC) family protein
MPGGVETMIAVGTGSNDQSNHEHRSIVDCCMDPFIWSWSLAFVYATKLGGAFLLALPIAWERERSTRMLGLRTFPLVAVASCGYILVGLAVVGDDANAQGRLLAGFMAGIGFIGGGAILKQGDGVRGTATAASIWATGVIGVAVGYAIYPIAVLVSLFTLMTLVLLTPIERMMGTHRRAPDKQD